MADATNAARASFQIWKALRSSDEKSRRLRIQLNDPKFVEFFHAAISAHYKIVFLEIGCLFDSDHRSASVRSLKRHLKSAQLKHLIELVDDKLTDKAKVVEGVLLIRSRLIAHRDITAESTEIHTSAEISPDMLESLIEDVSFLINHVSDQLGIQPQPLVSITRLYADATYQLGQAIEQHR